MLNYASRTRRAQWLIALGMFVPLIVLSVSTWLAFRSLWAQDSALLSVTAAVEYRDALVGIESGLIDVENCQRGYLLTGRDLYVEPFAAARGKVEARMIRIMRYSRGTDGNAAVQSGLRPLVEKRLAFAERIIRAKKEGSEAEVSALLGSDGGVLASKSIRQMIDQMIRDEESSIFDKEAAAGAVRQHTEMILVSLLVLDFTVLVTVIVLLARMLQMSRCVTMCAWSKKVQNDQEWISVHEYLDRYHGITVTHGISEEERDKFMAGLGIKPGAMCAVAA